MLYQAYQFQSDLMSPLRLMAQRLGASLWLDKTERSLVRRISAANEVISRMRLTHARPAYGITSVTVRASRPSPMRRRRSPSVTMPISRPSSTTSTSMSIT